MTEENSAHNEERARIMMGVRELAESARARLVRLECSRSCDANELTLDRA